jgi:hypothetical protein
MQSYNGWGSASSTDQTERGWPERRPPATLPPFTRKALGLLPTREENQVGRTHSTSRRGGGVQRQVRMPCTRSAASRSANCTRWPTQARNSAGTGRGTSASHPTAVRVKRRSRRRGVPASTRAKTPIRAGSVIGLPPDCEDSHLESSPRCARPAVRGVGHTAQCRPSRPPPPIAPPPAGKSRRAAVRRGEAPAASRWRQARAPPPARPPPTCGTRRTCSSHRGRH